MTPFGEAAGPPAAEDLRLQILGPLRIRRGGAELETGPRQQALLLALLLARPGYPTSADDLIQMIWGEHPPSTALNVVHKYIGACRRLLEPGLRLRDTGSYLLRRGTSYQADLPSGVLDLPAFRELVEAAETHFSDGNAVEALDAYVEGLRLWSGPAGGSLPIEPTATTVFTGLNDEFYSACVRATSVATSLHQSDRLLGPLRLAAGMAPYHESVHATLITSLAAAGHRAEALNVYTFIRRRLADDLGIDPGSALRDAHRTVLRDGLSKPPDATLTRAMHQTTSAFVPSVAGAGRDQMVGRGDELAVLAEVSAAVATGRRGAVVIDGEPGSGKTRLLRDFSAAAAAQGQHVVWGQCVDGGGAPSMWPWIDALTKIVSVLPARPRDGTNSGQLEALLSGSRDLDRPVLPEPSGQFRLAQDILGVLKETSTPRPLVLIFDDLQWADDASLEILGLIAAQLPRRVALVGSLRSHSPKPGTNLTRALAEVARVPGHRRVSLRPLTATEVGTLVEFETGRECTESVAQSISKKAAGNPFYVIELARLLATSTVIDETAIENARVPTSVRDIVSDRVRRLPREVTDLLGAAAIIGRQVDLHLLARATQLDTSHCLSLLEETESEGLLDPAPDNPFSYRFRHDLIRQAVYELVPHARAGALHLRVADSLEALAGNDEPMVELLAHHLWASGVLAEPSRTVNALVWAGRIAVVKSALDGAERQLRRATDLARAHGLTELELTALSELIAVVGMRSMYHTLTIDLLERAEQLSRATNRDLEATVFQYTRWTAHTQRMEAERAGEVARQLLTQGLASSDPMLRALGFQAAGLQSYRDGDMTLSRRRLDEAVEILMAKAVTREVDPNWHDMQHYVYGTLAEATAMHGDVDEARALLTRLEAMVDTSDPFAMTVWGMHIARTEVLIADPVRALRGAELAIAADKEFAFEFLSTYPRIAMWWARAMLGDDPERAAIEAEQLIITRLIEPPRVDVTTNYGLLAEIYLATGDPDRASSSIDTAESYAELGEHFTEGMLMLIRARTDLMRGAPADAVRALAQRAKIVSTERGTYLFARAADRFLAALPPDGAARKAGPAPLLARSANTR